MTLSTFFLLIAAFVCGILVSAALPRLLDWLLTRRRGGWWLVFLLLWSQTTGCAVSARYYRPVVYPTENVDMRNLPTDTETCRSFAQRATSEDPGMAEGALMGGLVAAVLGAAIGSAIGAAYGDAGLGALLGTVEGGAAGAVGGGGSNYIEREKRKKEAINLCLRARGYWVAN